MLDPECAGYFSPVDLMVKEPEEYAELCIESREEMLRLLKDVRGISEGFMKFCDYAIEKIVSE